VLGSSVVNRGFADQYIAIRSKSKECIALDQEVAFEWRETPSRELLFSELAL